jgi:GTPase SAR1 family protein
MDERARGRNKVKKGLTFTLMVVGASGTGKTTFVNTLCAKPVLEHKESDDPEHAHIEEGVRIKPVTVGPFPPPKTTLPFWPLLWLPFSLALCIRVGS